MKNQTSQEIISEIDNRIEKHKNIISRLRMEKQKLENGLKIENELLRQIQEIVFRKFNYDLKSRSRKVDFIVYKHAAQLIIKENDYTLMEVARMFECDHSTIISNINKVRDRITEPYIDIKTFNAYNFIKNNLQKSELLNK